MRPRKADGFLHYADVPLSVGGASRFPASASSVSGLLDGGISFCVLITLTSFLVGGGIQLAAKEKALATEERARIHGRAARYVVLPVESVRALNIRSDEEVIEAQRGITEDMLGALEEMVNAARAGKMEGRDVLAMQALSWG